MHTNNTWYWSILITIIPFPTICWPRLQSRFNRLGTWIQVLLKLRNQKPLWNCIKCFSPRLFKNKKGERDLCRRCISQSTTTESLGLISKLETIFFLHTSLSPSFTRSIPISWNSYLFFLPSNLRPIPKSLSSGYSTCLHYLLDNCIDSSWWVAFWIQWWHLILFLTSLRL